MDIVSDVHLQSLEDANGQAWLRWLRGSAADALFILGDLFEVWVGDDAAQEPGIEQSALTAMRQVAQTKPLYVLRGNRDFLLGTRCANPGGATLLADPSVLDFGANRWLLSHGDALCLADREYMQFRQQVRSHAWQERFLSQALRIRQQSAREMRAQSMATQAQRATHADADPGLTDAWLDAHQASAIIHGHTHRPATWAQSRGRIRQVLADWRAEAEPNRAVVCRIGADGSCRRLSVSEALAPGEFVLPAPAHHPADS